MTTNHAISTNDNHRCVLTKTRRGRIASLRMDIADPDLVPAAVSGPRGDNSTSSTAASSMVDDIGCPFLFVLAPRTRARSLWLGYDALFSEETIDY